MRNLWWNDPSPWLIALLHKSEVGQSPRPQVANSFIKFCVWATLILPTHFPHLQVILLFPEPDFKGLKQLSYFTCTVQCALIQWLLAVQLSLTACGTFQPPLKYRPNGLCGPSSWGLSGPDSKLGYWWSERELLYVSASVCGRKAHREAAFEKQPCRQQAFLPEFLLTHHWPGFLDQMPEAVWLVQVSLGMETWRLMLTKRFLGRAHCHHLGAILWCFFFSFFFPSKCLFLNH